MRSVVIALAFLGVTNFLKAEGTDIKKVVVIVADDHAMHATGIYGNDLVKTPHIDRLANEGVRFDNAFCNSPICSASRQSLLTGKYPIATGVNLLFTPFDDDNNVTVAEYLKGYGFKTALFGKTHFNNWVWGEMYENYPQHGFDVLREGVAYKEYYKKLDEKQKQIPEGVLTYEQFKNQGVANNFNARVLPHAVKDRYSEGTYVAEQAIQFIEDHKEEDLFVWVAFHQPHHPYYFPIEYQGMYEPADMVLPETSAEDDRWVPEKFKNLTLEQRKGIMAAYYTSVSYMDKNIGLVVDAIKEKGLEDETLIIYLSDNGYLLNHHKRFEKHTMWEEATRQPTILKHPTMEAKVCDALIEYVDIAPTIVDCLNLPPMSEAQGKSILSTIGQNVTAESEKVFATYLEDNMAMVRTKKWKYVFTTGSRDLGIGYQTGLGPSGIFHRLYDLENDPKELQNLAYNEAYSTTLARMKEELLEYFSKNHPEASKCPKGLSMEGKLVWFCEPRDIGANQGLKPQFDRVFHMNP
ncbi:sulfatase family protein [Persicobacter diffluens]|uniref:Acetylglucosamine-6-sulfatase n=1 Tax=Persicobacter diffluens TaxID=981 RepID=A0AAN5API4_9BACT|nr:acetylglucosamine-6-sulfatase [Persicobacter diffluens]